jgi:hypothetical protein
MEDFNFPSNPECINERDFYPTNKEDKSRKRDLNPRPTDLQSVALPTELFRDNCIK